MESKPTTTGITVPHEGTEHFKPRQKIRGRERYYAIVHNTIYNMTQQNQAKNKQSLTSTYKRTHQPKQKKTMLSKGLKGRSRTT